MNTRAPLQDLSPFRFESPAILKKVASAGRRLAELKGAASAIPRQSILINTFAIAQGTRVGMSMCHVACWPHDPGRELRRAIAVRGSESILARTRKHLP
jgi:hypothetical protein